MDKPAFPTVDTEKMMRLPVGAISPLWLMFAGAATVGAAYFWSRTFFKPTNLEALISLPEAARRLGVASRGLVNIARQRGLCSPQGRETLFSESDLKALAVLLVIPARERSGKAPPPRKAKAVFGLGESKELRKQRRRVKKRQATKEE